MNLETVPAPVEAGQFNVIVSASETERQIMTFAVTVSGFPEAAYTTLNAVIKAFEGPYSMREFTESTAFSLYRQSTVNMIGSFRESIELDFRYALWGMLTAAGYPGDGWSMSLVQKDRQDVIRVAFDGSIYTFSPGIVKNDGYRDECTTCQDGRRLLQIALNEINGAVVVDGATFDEADSTFAYGKNNRIKAIPGDTKLVVSNPRDFSDDVSSFPDWFREMNVGARDMASSEVYFSLV